MNPTALWHYTCGHGRDALREHGTLLPLSQHSPNVAARLPDDFAWLGTVAWATDMAQPDRSALGLTTYALDCDRTQHRYRVAFPERFQWWPRVRRIVPPLLRQNLEESPGAMPAHWWVTFDPAPVRVDPR